MDESLIIVLGNIAEQPEAMAPSVISGWCLSARDKIQEQAAEIERLKADGKLECGHPVQCERSVEGLDSKEQPAAAWWCEWCSDVEDLKRIHSEKLVEEGGKRLEIEQANTALLERIGLKDAQIDKLNERIAELETELKGKGK